MFARALVLMLSLVIAGLPSLAGACELAAAFSPSHRSSDSTTPHDCCPNGQTDPDKSSWPSGLACSMASVCAFTGAAPPSHGVLAKALPASTPAATLSAPLASTDTPPPLRPPIA